MIKDKRIDFFTADNSLKSWLFKAREHQNVYIKSDVPPEIIGKQMEYWVAQKPDSFYKRERQSPVFAANDPMRIIRKVQRYPDRFPLGIIMLNARFHKGGHTTAFTSDRTYLYYYDPAVGFMKAARNSVNELRDIFIESYRFGFYLYNCYMVYANRPVTITEPYSCY